MYNTISGFTDEILLPCKQIMVDRKIKIGLFMAPPLTNGAGAGEYFMNLARDFAEKGADVEVVTLDRSFFKLLARLLRIFYRLDFLGKSIKNRKDLETEKSVLMALGGAKWKMVSVGELKSALSKYDVIYTKNEVLELIFVKLIGYRNLPPVIVGVHTPLCYPVVKTVQEKLHNFIYTGFIYKFLLFGCAFVHLSNAFTKQLVDRKFGVPTKFIYYPFSVEEISGKAKETKSGFRFSEGKVKIIFLARMTEQKGIDILVNVIDRLSKDKNLTEKIEINIFGKGALEHLAADLDARYKFVNYCGYVEHSQIPNILSKHDLFITTAQWETLPFNVLEAQSMGLPAVAFDIPGPNDIIIHGKTGYLAQSEDEFLDYLKVLVMNFTKFDKEEIVNGVVKRFSSDKIYAELYDMFIGCINLKRSDKYFKR
ncbi:glycosyltransferase family 4 protein [Patescibacteria group bacterium]|nr:glycosyltransferase family 4 protein [Patescibacteria group bacterium]